MRVLFLLWALGSALVGLEAQTQSSPFPWNPSPAAAEEAARSSGKPVLLLWQAGSAAPAFTQGIERLFSAWPQWAKQIQRVTVTARGRSWEGPLPATFPPLPNQGLSSVLMIWNPGSPIAPYTWTEVPAVLDLSRRIALASGREVGDPYKVDITEFQWEDGGLVRVGDGPVWTTVGAENPSTWIEEGPLGTVLILKETSSERKAAFPFQNDWSFLFDPSQQSWTAWKPVLVKR